MHKCKALLIHCMDFRLEADIHKFLTEQNLTKNCDIVSVAGAAKDIAADNGEYLMKQINTSVSLHQITDLIIMHHTDCGAYGGNAAFASAEEERQQHIQDMEKAKARILTQYPNINIKLVLATILPDKIQLDTI